MADNSGNPNIPAYENSIIMWGKEPDGTHFVPLKWDKTDLTEPNYKPSGWDQSLFSTLTSKFLAFFGKKFTGKVLLAIIFGSGYHQVRTKSTITIPEVKSHNPPFVLNKTGHTLTVTVAQDLKIGLYSLNGRKIYSEFVNKGSLCTFNTRIFSMSILFLRITGKGIRKHSIFLVIPWYDERFFNLFI